MSAQRKPARTPITSQNPTSSGHGEQSTLTEMRTRQRAALRLVRKGELEPEDALLMVVAPTPELLAAQRRMEAENV